MNIRKNKELIYLIPSVIILSLVFIITYLYSDNVITSDMSAELILAKELLREHKLFTKNWFYSTEVRVIYTQVVSMILFLFIESWNAVRAGMNLICSILMVISYLYMMKPLGISKKVVYLSTSLLLIPFSLVFITIIQIGNSYMPHIIFSFLAMGLTLRLFNEIKKKNLFFYILVMIICGISGIRYALVFVLPLLAAIFIICEEEAYKAEKTIFYWDLFKDKRVKIALVCVGSYFSGYLINSLYFGRYYSFDKYDSLCVTNFVERGFEYGIIEHLSKMITDIFRLFGYVEGIGIKSFSGIQSIASIAFVCAFLFIIWTLYRSKGTDKNEKFFKLFSFMLFAMHAAVFVFLDHMSGISYLILVYVFFVPLIAVYFEKYCRKVLDLSKMANMLFIICSIILCITNLRYIVVRDDNYYIKDVVQFLEENQAKFGMATFWNGDVLTELSNGEIQVVNIDSYNFIDAYEWLMPTRFIERNTWEIIDSENFFVLLRFTDLASMELDGNAFAYEVLSKGELVYSDNGYSIYFYDRDTFINTYASYICND